MVNLSEDDSSDSGNESLVSAKKNKSVDLNKSTKKSNPKNKKKIPAKKQQPKQQQKKQERLSDDTDDEFDYANDNVSSAQLLAQVLKNLENVQNSNPFAKSTDQSEITKTEDDSKVDSKSDNLSNEINDLLLQGESAATLSNQDDVDDSKAKIKTEYTVPDKGVQIHLPGENLMFDKKKRKQRDLRKVLQSKINSRIRTAQNYCHKVGLLCWLAHGFHLNNLAMDPELLAISLSLVPPNNCPKEKPDLKYLEKFTKWFAQQFTIHEEHKQVSFNKDALLKRISDRKIYNYVEMVLLFVAMIRGMGINCRLVISLRPPHLKPTPNQLFKMNDNSGENDASIKSEKVDEKLKEKSEVEENTETTQSKNKDKNKNVPETESASPSELVPENSLEGKKTTRGKAEKKATEILKGKNVKKSSKEDNTAEDDSPKPVRRTRRSVYQTEKKNEENNDKNDGDSESNNSSVALKTRNKVDKSSKKSNTNKTDKSISKNIKDNSNISASRRKRKHSSSNEEESDYSEKENNSSDDEEYVEKKVKKTAKKTTASNKSKSSTIKSHNKSGESSKTKFSNEVKEKSEVAFNIWVEVYVEAEKSWISVNVLGQKIDCVPEIYDKAGQPVLYILSWNSAGTIKDVTRRYCSNWLTDTRKKRVDEKWWNDTLQPWKEAKTPISKAEDEQLLQRELEQPLPNSVSECKGHPLYVLTRHLLKYEALYPPECMPLGHLKTGETVFSRHCVHTLMARERWVKKARVVKPGEQPYKIVTAFPKFDKLSGKRLKDQPLELFGRWQTMPYEPPEAKDGKVPRNEYGSVDLFKMCMLPKGTAYVNLPGLNRIARKLDIDCAPACVGFTFGRRGALPAFEGFIVCEEYEDAIRQAWEEEQIEAQKRAEEKREKRVYGNWKKLIKGLLIREKLAAKYNFGDDDDDDGDKKKSVKKKIPMEIEEKRVIKKKEPKMKKKAGLLVKLLKSDSEGEDDEDFSRDRNVAPKARAAQKSLPARKQTGSSKQRTTTAPKRAPAKRSKKVDTDEESLELDSDAEISDVEKEEQPSTTRRRSVRAAALKAPIKEVSDDDESGDDGDDDYKADEASDDDDDFEEEDGLDELVKSPVKVIKPVVKTPSMTPKRKKQEQPEGSARKKVKR